MSKKRSGEGSRKSQRAGEKGSAARAHAVSEVTYPTVPAAELNRLLSLKHTDPHAILGAHETPAGIVVRAFRPKADRVNLLIEGEPPRSMVQSHPAGFFELLLHDRTKIFPYLLEIHYPGGNVFTIQDPYRFLPTLGELDIYLFGAGKHEQLYEKLGSHVRKIQGVSGVSF